MIIYALSKYNPDSWNATAQPPFAYFTTVEAADQFLLDCQAWAIAMLEVEPDQVLNARVGWWLDCLRKPYRTLSGELSEPNLVKDYTYFRIERVEVME